MNHYETLEVSPKASPEVIRAAFKSLMQRHHPDRHPGDEAAALKAAQVASAYEVLSDPAKRADYDAKLRRQQAPAAASSPAARRAPVRTTRSPRAASRLPSVSKAFPWGAVGLAVAAIAVGVAVAMAFKPAPSSQAELASIRSEMSAPGTAEATRQRLHARKVALLAANPELDAVVARELANDRLNRTWNLTTHPTAFKVRVDGELGEETVTVTVPLIRVVAGSFDTAAVLAHWASHRETFLAQLPEALLQERLPRGDAQALAQHVRQVVARVLSDGMGDAPQRDYPSTYHESPGRYGVVDVLLTDPTALR
ncbi:MAG TPA: J domain-containing protein [Burkholderiaceae bacterium]|nr:J domain-containing protein [Burkholderiaceae bacterium]